MTEKSEFNSPAANFDEEDTLDCSAVIADLWLYLDNEADDATRQRLLKHLECCSGCLDHHDSQARLKEIVRRKCGGEAAPSRLIERIKIKISETIIITER